MLITEEAVNLNQLCTRLLQTAKLEASSVTLRTEPVIVSKLVNDVVADLSGTLKGHPIEMSIEESDTPLQGDRELLKMILTQYLDNAASTLLPRRRSALRCARASRSCFFRCAIKARSSRCRTASASLSASIAGPTLSSAHPVRESACRSSRRLPRPTMDTYGWSAARTRALRSSCRCRNLKWKGVSDGHWKDPDCGRRDVDSTRAEDYAL